MTTTLIKNGHLLSVDPRIGNVAHCDVHVRDGQIVEIGPDLAVTDADVIDATGTIIAPGFVDTHRHLWETVLRGTLPDGTLGEYFVSVMGTLAPHFRDQDVYAGGLAGAYEALNAGITTVVDWNHCLNTPAHADAAVAALRETRIRAVFAHGWPGGFDWLMDSAFVHPEDARRVRSQHFSSDEGLLTFALALRGPATLGMEVNRADFALARELEARITVHAGMRIAGRPVREVDPLRQADLLGPEVTYVHCNTTPEEDLRVIADSGGTVSISPHIEMVMGHGAPPTGRLLAAGLRPTLSCDVTTTSPGDMFTQMRAALAHERASSLPQDPMAEFTPSLTAEDVLRFATIDGAAACGLADRTGSLTPGKRADVVLVRMDAINMVPVTDPVAALVTCADVSNIDTVLVEGVAVKRHGVLLGADVTRIAELLAGARAHVTSQARTPAHQ